jgi:GTPase SAR1 family protein
LEKLRIFVIKSFALCAFVAFVASVQVDILDTSGDMQFPAMRRLSIATAHAFLLVYSVTSAPSLISVKQCFEEIREQRADYQVSVADFSVLHVAAAVLR